MTERVINIAFRIVFHCISDFFQEKIFNNAILFIYFRRYCQFPSNMSHIVGFRKIISFKIGIKNIPSYLKKHLTLNNFLKKI
jgi:hypothetical protein